jgi:enediyne biosynthesis protein E3
LRLKAWLSHLRQGSDFAVKLRHRAGTVVEHTKLACQMLAGLSAEEAVRMVNAAFLGLPSDGKEPAYEILRRQVQVQLALREELAV